MHLEKYQTNGTEYIRLVRTIYKKDKQGKISNRKEVVKTFGKLSKYEDGKPDYYARLRQSFQDGKPLIPELMPYIEEAPKKKFRITITEGDEFCVGRPKYMASCLLDPIFSALGLSKLFASIKHECKIEYDLQGIVRLLTYSRILNPASKMATMRQNDKYYMPLVKSTNNDNVYDALDVIWKKRKQIIRRMNTCITKGIGRNSSTVFYDVTNFFFETEEPDKDIVDEAGNTLEKGLRKMGVSKENRKQPIVQMGLFLDDNGIPISIEIFPGNTLDHLTLRSAMRNTVDNLGFKRFILIADRGMYSGTNMCHVLNQGNGYIVSKSLKRSSKRERDWTLDPEGYVQLSEDFKYKSHIVTRTVTDEDGNQKQIREKIVVYWSRAFYERERYENLSFLEFIEKLKANPHGFRVTAAQSRSLKRFLKKDLLDKQTGEILDGSKLLAMIDEEKLTEFNDLMGYYQIATSELDMPDTEVIDKYHGLSRIEDQFREMKGTLKTRPIYVRTPEHIYAHLLVCFIALTILRLIQLKIVNAMPNNNAPLNWSYGLSGQRISSALSLWQVEQLSDEYFRMNNLDDPDIVSILHAFNILVPHTIFTKSGILSLKSSVSAF